MAIKTFKANGDLTGKVGYAVNAHTNGGEVELADTKAQVCLGILVNDAPAGKPVSVALTGEVVKAKVGGAVNCGDALIAKADGSLMATDTAGDFITAVALEDGADGDKIYVEVVKYTKHA